MDALVTLDAELAVREAVALAPATVRELDRLIPSAVAGSETAARAYARAWRSLVDTFLRAVRAERPDVIAATDDGGLVVIDANGSASPASERMLDYLALQAPFSPWVARFGPGRGAAVFLLNELRAAVTGLEPLPAAGSPPPHWAADETDLARFSRAVLAARSEPELHWIMTVFGLTTTGTARLFGVSRQALSQWLDDGVPAARASKVAVVARIADLLDRMIDPERLSGIVRTPADRLRRPDDARDDRAGPPRGAPGHRRGVVRLVLDGMRFRHVERGGRYLRVADPSWVRPLDGRYARERGGRWNAPGSFGVVYLFQAVDVARSFVLNRFEGHPYSAFDLRPEAGPDLVETDVPPERFVDVVTDDGCRAAGLPVTYPRDEAGEIVAHEPLPGRRPRGLGRRPSPASRAAAPPPARTTPARSWPGSPAGRGGFGRGGAGRSPTGSRRPATRLPRPSPRRRPRRRPRTPRR